MQNEIIKYNDTLGKKKKLQISINQCHFLYLVTKLFKPKEILEIGAFTGLSSLSMCIGLENDSKITTIDKNKETSLVAKNFFEKAKVSEQINIIIDEKGLKQQSDPKEIEKIVDDMIKENPKNVELFKSGKDKLFGFFVGQVMKKTDGKANPKLVNDILKKKLN